jgi:large subunit ribosomal protein L29
MAFPKISEVRDLSDAELAEAIVDAKKQLFDLRLKQATQQLEKTHEFKHLRHRIAQLLTVERERQLAAVTESAAPTTAEPASTETTPSEEE